MTQKPHERYAALASHYAFDPLFCMPASGNEKAYTENRVFDPQQRFATPVPKVKDLSELNAYLRTCCLKERERIVAGQTEIIGRRFDRDCAEGMPLPTYPFDPCVRQDAQVDKYQTARFDNVRYSVLRAYAFRKVTVRASSTLRTVPEPIVHRTFMMRNSAAVIWGPVPPIGASPCRRIFNLLCTSQVYYAHSNQSSRNFVFSCRLTTLQIVAILIRGIVVNRADLVAEVLALRQQLAVGPSHEGRHRRQQKLHAYP